MSQTSITKVDTKSAGYVSEVAICALNDEFPQLAEAATYTKIATAVCASGGDLKVIIWESSNGIITRLCDGPAGGASQIAVAGLTSSDLVTAFRSVSDGGDLGLIVWTYTQDSSGHHLSRAVSKFAGGTSGPIAVARLTSSRFVTALPDLDGNLILIVWDYSNGELLRRGSGRAGGADIIQLASLSSSRVVTAVRGSTGKLTLIVWDIDKTGLKVTRRGSATGRTTQAIAVNTLSDNRIATSISDVSDGTGNLRVDVWDVDGSGNVYNKGNASAGPVDSVAGGDARTGVFPTAVRETDGKLKIIAWDVASGISKAAELATSEKIRGLAAATLLRSSESMIFATGLISPDVNVYGGDLEVVNWGIKSDIRAYDPTKQSPKPLLTEDATPKYDPKAKPVFSGTFSSVMVEAHKEDGHTIDVVMYPPWNSNPQVTLQIGRPDSTGTCRLTKYRVLQIHMHRHSEHTINGQVAPLEMHCVLTDPIPDHGESRPDPTAVLAFLILKGTNNEALNFYFDYLEHPDGKVEFTVPPLATVEQNLNLLLPTDKTYLSYHGSLTSPHLGDEPLNMTPVLWYVLRNEITVSADQYAKYEQAVAEHCRVLQMGNDSAVWMIIP